MTREKFIEVLDEKRYSYEIKGDKIVITHKGYVDLLSLKTSPPGVVFENGGDVWLSPLTSLPPRVEFKNGKDVYLDSLKTLPPGVEFRNGRDVDLDSLIGGWFSAWNGNIEGISSNRLLNKMIELELFNRR